MIFVGGQWENVNSLEPLKVLIGQTCLSGCPKINEKSETENVTMVGTLQSF